MSEYEQPASVQDEPVARERAGTLDETATLQPLFDRQETDDFRQRWHAIQASFVDEPRTSVEQADALVAELMQRLQQTFADERKQLERGWNEGEDVDTETHRVALRRYRSFFERLLSAQTG
jgi:hypothetical protein